MEDSPQDRLHDTRTGSNQETLAAVRLVPATPPRLLGLADRGVYAPSQIEADDRRMYTRSALPTHPAHILLPGGKGKEVDTAAEFQQLPILPKLTSASGQSFQTIRPDAEYASSETTPTSKPKPLPRKRLQLHKDNKTFSLLQDEQVSQDDDLDSSASSINTSTATDGRSYSVASYNTYIPESGSATSVTITTEGRSASPASQNTYTLESGSATSVTPSTPETPRRLSNDHAANSPWNYELAGGVRKVPKNSNPKQDVYRAFEASSPPPLPRQLPESASSSQENFSKPSNSSTKTASTISEDPNYEIYSGSVSSSDAALPLPSSSHSNYQLHGDSSPAPSVIYKPQSAQSDSENENYQLHGDPSPASSTAQLSRPAKYSQESLIVPPLNPRAQRSNESLGYYKSRSRESLRTPSLTSISSIFKQQEAYRAVVDSGLLGQLPSFMQSTRGSGAWAGPSGTQPPRAQTDEHIRQWSPHLSTVFSVSDGSTDGGSRSWPSDNTRRASGFVRASGPQSRRMLSISSSAGDHQSRSRSNSIEYPQPALARTRIRANSSLTAEAEDQDEYGDTITDLQDLRGRSSKTQLSVSFNTSPLDAGRSDTMRSNTSSRANSLSRASSFLANSIPTWARLYYSSGGERRFLGTPEGTETSGSRATFFRNASPNPDLFPARVHSPRRRPRQAIEPADTIEQAPIKRSSGVMPTQEPAREVQAAESRDPSRFRTWSMSSIWSPHLRPDRRAQRPSVWKPTPIDWTAGSACFVIGFIFPFGKFMSQYSFSLNICCLRYITAWMVAALLPIPETHKAATSAGESKRVSSRFDLERGQVLEDKLDSARSWRRLNRFMSLLGLLIIAIVVSI